MRIFRRYVIKFFFQIIFKIFLTLTILAGCAPTEQIKETDPDALFSKGIALLITGQTDRAIGYFNKAIEINTKAIEINPKDAKAYNNRGRAYYLKSKSKNAAFEMYSEMYPPDRGLIDKACSDWKRACELGECKDWWERPADARNTHGPCE